MSNYIEQQFSLKGRLAWITGAVYGIGFAIATAYAKAGCSIAINTNTPEQLEKGLEDYRKAGITDVRGYLSDVTKEDEVKATVAAIEKDFGRKIDILVNNAGIIKRIPMIEMSAEDFRKVIDIDLNGPFICSKAVIPGMIEMGHGKIINPTVQGIRSTSSSSPRHRQQDGEHPKTSRVRPSSLPPKPVISSTATSSMSMAASSPTSASSPDKEA